ALDGLRQENDTTRLIGVTQLTSTDERMMQTELGISGRLDQAVLRQATLAKQAGLDGVVASVQEAKAIHQKLGDTFMTVTPGIRLGATEDDQVRIATPHEARLAGVHSIVVGRPITRATDPMAMYDQFMKEWGLMNETNR
ncbi:MAG: orotidine 5'-phosphate decarboxylase / HUMPS family protein, partial [Exiguobacterium sp.]